VIEREVNNLADVLKAMTEWNASKDAPLSQQVACLRVIVEQLATTMALHAVQIGKLREALLLVVSQERE
jgi:hypothetical protein